MEDKLELALKNHISCAYQYFAKNKFFNFRKKKLFNYKKKYIV